MDYRTRLREASKEIIERRITSDDELRKIADKYNLPLSTVKTLSTFYFHDYSEVQVCMGLPCLLKGAREVVKELERRGIKYSITYCLGYCDRGVPWLGWVISITCSLMVSSGRLRNHGVITFGLNTNISIST
ncbi:NAD(P)H-dependent oxidoreductase subunit E [Vulcanisaeta distributa]|uniref:NAD(P)H-dependent oxidoreductase subunit E n=1 Tax=Vulcanisaeta distributa TaxID=164451 RepID=UPI001FB5445B|nr:NAD(P)H-dependent oxidoreductase subunit E [Vulcanisaeta distributa]